jgi:hypothetical protein
MGGESNWIEAVGYLGALLTLITYSMQRMIPLRIIAIFTNCAMIAYGLLEPVYPQLLVHSILLPLNAFRLHEMLQLIAKVRMASRGDLNMEWLKPFMTRRVVKQGQVLFRKGDISSDMVYTITGRYRLTEIHREVGPGEVIGEIGLIAPENKRMLTFEVVEDGEILTLGYPQVKQLYYQNPEFGFYLLQLISLRLFKDLQRMQARVAAEA